MRAAPRRCSWPSPLMGEGWVGVTAPVRGTANEKASNRRRTRARASPAPGDDQSRDKAVADAAITTNRGASVPLSGAARVLHCGFCLSRSPPDRRTRWRQLILWRSRRRREAGSCKSEGNPVLRFCNDEVLANPEGVHAIIVENFAAASPPPNPPQSRGRALSK